MMRFLIFIALYLLVYGGMHLYFYRRLRRAFALTGAWRTATLAFLLLMVFGPMISRGLEALGWAWLTGPVALLVYVWMGWLFLAASCFFIVDILRLLDWLLARTLRHSSSATLVGWRPLFVAVALFSLVASGYGLYAARQLHVETVTIPTAKLPAGIASYRMVQLSDVHLGVMSSEAWLAHIVDVVNGLHPDLIVSTGDMIDSNVPAALPFQQSLARLQAPDGKYAVAGNHEFFAGIDSAVAYMEQSGFVMLRGERREVEPWLHLSGVDDREARLTDGNGVDHEKLLVAQLDRGALNILLKHQPVVRAESVGHFDLQLAGHVHQGQLFPFRLLTWLAYPVAMGLSEVGMGAQLYVARGTGTWGPPMRVLAPPEITLFEFVRVP